MAASAKPPKPKETIRNIRFPRKAKRARNSSVSSSSIFSSDSASLSDHQKSSTNKNSLLRNAHERSYSLRKSTRANDTNLPVLFPFKKSISRPCLPAKARRAFGKNNSSSSDLLDAKERLSGINKENEVAPNHVITRSTQLKTPKRPTKICPLSKLVHQTSSILTSPKVSPSVSSPVTDITPSPLKERSWLPSPSERRETRSSRNSSYYFRSVKRRSFEENCGCFSCYSSPDQSPPIKMSCSTSRARRKRRRKSKKQCDIDSITKLCDRSSSSTSSSSKLQRKTKVEKATRKCKPRKNKSAPAKMQEIPLDVLGSAFTPLGKRKFVASPKRIKPRVPKSGDIKKMLVQNCKWLKKEFPSKSGAGEDDAFRPCLFKPIPLLEYESDIASISSSPHSMAFSPALQRSPKRKAEADEEEDLESLHALRRMAQKNKLMEKVNVTSTQLSGESSSSSGLPSKEIPRAEMRGLEKIVTQLQNIQDNELCRKDDDDGDREEDEDN